MHFLAHARFFGLLVLVPTRGLDIVVKLVEGVAVFKLLVEDLVDLLVALSVVLP